MLKKTFADYLNEDNKWVRTENNALAVNTTGSPLLDLFGTVGALRTRPLDVIGLFEKAFSEDKLLATKMCFYARDIRSGLKERLVSRVMWRWLAENYPEIMAKNIAFVPEFGRWDDLYALIGTELEDSVWKMFGEQLKADLRNMRAGKPVSLLAKWLKSTNTSSKASVEMGKLTAKKLGLSQEEYRKTLSVLRKYIDVTEVKMSANKWDKIKYEAVPSKAMTNYRKAFGRHDTERFGEFITAVQKGEKTIHSATLYPYDIFEKMGFRENRNYYSRSGNTANFTFDTWDAVLEEQWKALPNYVESGENVLIVADTSGSMAGRPVCTSVGLAVYFAERNVGQFHNKFITFSSVPKFVTISGKTLKEKIEHIPAIVENTNLEAVFDLVLKTAVENKVPYEDMPKALVIISDFQIDELGGVENGRKETFHTTMQKKFASAGYALPNMIYWQVDARRDTFHAEKNEKGVQLASGQSPSVFKSILNSIGKDAYEMMVDTLSDPRYDCITI